MTDHEVTELIALARLGLRYIWHMTDQHGASIWLGLPPTEEWLQRIEAELRQRGD